jgi:diguanylate cyclase (GGDEF)-like protein
MTEPQPINSSTRELWLALESHLSQAQTALRKVMRTDSAQAASPDQRQEVRELYLTARQRAEAEIAKVTKLESEMDLLRSQTRESLRDVQKLAYQDPLTGLANLHLLHQHLDFMNQDAGISSQTLLVAVDLDRFHEFNEVLGTDQADQVLVRVAERLSQMVGPRDALARRGEDEFLLAFSEIPSSEVVQRAKQMMGKIAALIRQPFLIDGQRLELTASVGASYFPLLADSSEKLLDQTNRALLAAKKLGRNRSCLFDEQLQRGVQREAKLEFQMRRALEAGEFYLEYLPIFSLEKTKNEFSGRILGVEALLRWNHRTEGFLQPHTFLPLAENSGFIVPLGHWVVRTVCRQLEEWYAQGLSLYATINLCGRQLLQTDLAEGILAETKAHNISPQSLTFEIEENFASLNEAHIDETIDKLQQAGFTLAIDKFGSYYSSLSRLSCAQFLKLSRHLLEPENLNLLTKAMAVSRGMGLSGIGVGAETVEAVERVYRSGCALVQGHAFSPAVAAKEVRELAKRAWTLPLN